MFISCKEGRRPKGEAKVRDVSCICGLMERFRDPSLQAASYLLPSAALSSSHGLHWSNPASPT